MATQQIAFETYCIALEATRGTKITPPTHRANGKGTITPVQTLWGADDQVGELAGRQRDEITRRFGTYDFEGALDVNFGPVLCNKAIAPVTSPTTPTGATLSRLWAFIGSMTADNIKSSTDYFGDPNMTKMLQGGYSMLDEFSWDSDATSEDGATMSFSGSCQFPGQVNPPALPAANLSKLFAGGRMQLFLDTSLAIGTTEITGRVLTAKGKIPTGVTFDYPASGPTGTVTYSETGREKTSPEMEVEFMFKDFAQYQLFEDGTYVKCRVRMNSATEIEAGFPFYFEHDIYGKLDAPSWEEYNSGRAIKFKITGVKDPTLGSDRRVAWQNNRTTL